MADPLGPCILAVLFLFLAAIVCALNAALPSVDEDDARDRAKQGDPAAQRLARLLDRYDRGRGDFRMAFALLHVGLGGRAAELGRAGGGGSAQPARLAVLAGAADRLRRARDGARADRARQRGRACARGRDPAARRARRVHPARADAGDARRLRHRLRHPPAAAHPARRKRRARDREGDPHDDGARRGGGRDRVRQEGDDRKHLRVQQHGRLGLHGAPAGHHRH